MAIEWTEILSVGVTTIDEQHKMLFKKADELFEAGKNGKAKDYIAQLLNFLDEYTKKHFGDEEKYMQSIRYPALEAQKKMHADFISALTKLKKEYEESGGNIIVIINANQMVVDWLIKHISGEDKKIGVFAKGLKG
jgi:hemerythrin